ENTSIDVSVDDSDEFDIAADTKASYKAKQTSAIQQLFRHIGNIFVPIIPGLVASGLMLGIANIILYLADAGIMDRAIFESDWYMLLEATGNLVFVALVVFAGINAARDCGGIMVRGGIAGLLICTPVLDGLGTLRLFGLILEIGA